ncbi:M13 family metallopeptidase [Hymenobacter sp. BT770]|uniref:M13 family metallopeptidase n=1 Tax=Hymenobacter sp. BT770 TaxID=2886942 RepID=UPI001D0FDEC2|nr:M13 family metallopeptidase [Hymenobacter sp. BT770]MCC3151978.1 M13 family metallopeptidase [Hymenobacter sp. BT770]MDO3417088.1 M13 family metallopeptidase [Hymenobacter sp. BT770]
MISTSIQRRLSLALLGLGGLAATVAAGPPTTKPAPTPPQKGVGINIANIDPSVKPCEDFFHYASGNWMKNNPIPASETRWGSLNELTAHNQAALRLILNDAAKNAAKAAKGTNAQKVGDFYASAMDSAAIEAAGLKYLQPHLNRIAAIKDLGEMQRFLADPKAPAGNVWFGAGVGQDDKISSQYAVQLRQGGLSLPDRDNYLKDDARSKAIRAAYDTYLVNTFKMLGDDAATAKANATAVQRIETRLAKASKGRVELRDPYANYNKMTVAEANAAYPNLALPLSLKGNDLGAAKEVIVGQPDFLKEVNTMLKEEPIADQKQYLRWHLVTSLTAALPQAFGDESFRFSQVVSGAKQQQPRWKRALSSTDRTLGFAFGQLYVDKAFSPAAKARAKQMIENLRVAYAERIKATDWMSAGTKAEALKKLNAFTVKIGYPDKWKDYSGLNISRESYLNNLLAAREWATKDQSSHFGKPIDRTEWGMTPPTVNAYYSPAKNEIVFPAGILQPPFFDPKADDAVNYGGIGAVIGHEMTHGFDDQGRQYDAQGNLKDWWTKEDAEKFNAKADAVGKQYDAFMPLDSVHVNGKLTMGENLADLGGLTIAYQAFEKTPQAKAQAKIDGFTPEQRFFLAFGQVWRTNIRPEAVRQQVQTDPHSPAQFRTNGPLMNMPEFYKAFGCQDGNKMMRAAADRSKIW